MVPAKYKRVDLQIVPALLEETKFEIPFTIEKNTKGTKIIFNVVIKIWPAKMDISETYCSINESGNFFMTNPIIIPAIAASSIYLFAFFIIQLSP